MEWLLHSASLVSASAVSNLVSAVWEGAVLVLGAALCLRMLPRLSAAARSLVWLNVFVLLVVLHFAPAAVATSLVAAPAVRGGFELDLRWSFAIAGLWAALSLWRAVQLAASAVRLRGLVNRAVRLEPPDSIRALLVFGRAARAAELCTSEEVARPSVFGFFKPRILIPPALVEELSEAELRHVVVHEMEHLRRADDWTNLLQKIALVLFPLNPVLIWVERRLCAERELACDDRVVLDGAAGKAYAICLTHLAEYSMLRRSLSLVLGAWERRPELARRVHRLLRRPRPVMGRMQAGMTTAGLLAVVVGSGVALARSPRLVSFAKPEMAPAAMSASGTVAPDFAAQRRMQARMERATEAAPKLVQAKAILPEKPRQAHGPAITAERKHRSASGAAPAPETAQQTWMVLTEWTDVNLPARPVLVKLDPRGSYAAVPVVGGWLIVRI